MVFMYIFGMVNTHMYEILSSNKVGQPTALTYNHLKHTSFLACRTSSSDFRCLPCERLRLATFFHHAQRCNSINRRPDGHASQ